LDIDFSLSDKSDETAVLRLATFPARLEQDEENNIETQNNVFVQQRFHSHEQYYTDSWDPSEKAVGPGKKIK
jgi:hypothetical protein